MTQRGCAQTKRCISRESEADNQADVSRTKENEKRISTRVFLGRAAFANLLFRQRATRWRATLAQLVEQLIRNQQVAGSNPAGGSKKSNRFNRFFNLDTLFVRATAKSLPIRFGFVEQIGIALIDAQQ
jgi:hypothetical protein